MHSYQGLILGALVLTTAGCAKNYSQEQQNMQAAAQYASVNRAISQDQQNAKKELVICTREKPLGTLIATVVCRKPELLALEQEQSRNRMTRTELRNFNSNK